MTNYRFQLRLRFSEGSVISEDAEAITIIIPPNNTKIIFQSRPTGTALREAKILDAIAEDFPSFENALACGRQIRDAIKVSCTLLAMGVEIGMYEEFHQDDEDNADGTDIIQLKGINGLIVYPQNKTLSFWDMRFSARGGPRTNDFQKVFLESYVLSANLDDKVKLAFELYNSHFFDISIRARFLQLISIVEVLAKPARQQTVIAKHVKDLVNQSNQYFATINKDDLPEDEYQNFQDQCKPFIEGLNRLKRESISSACRKVVGKYLDDEAVILFKECYNIRSTLTHDGALSSNVNLSEYYWKLDYLIRKLLHTILTQLT